MLANFLNSSCVYLNTLLMSLVLLNAAYLHSATENHNIEEQNKSIFNENSDSSEVDEIELDDITYRNLQILRGHPDYIEDHRLRLEELREESTNDQLASLDIFSAPSYLFLREGSGFLFEQKIEDAKKVQSDLKKKKLSKVNFASERLNEAVNGHTCTAMALDFLSRYIKNCSTLTKNSDLKKYVGKFKPYYRNSTTTFTSRQAAFNTIQVDRSTSLSDPELMKYRKMQSLANYHGLKLNSVTETINIDEIRDNPIKFMSIVDSLPNGYYVIRALSPADNHKMEYYGHTMILIKGKVFSVYYDNADGAVEITNDVSGYVKDKLLAWSIPEFKIYNAKHDPVTGFNLATEVNQE